jgi:hypothetical protein
MKCRTALMLVVIMVVGLGIAVPQPVLAQSDPFVGTWQLNLAKSKFPPPTPKSQTVNIQAEGQGLKVTVTGVGAEGNPISNAFAHVFDRMPHPSNRAPNIYDAITDARVDAYTLISSRTEAGKLVSIQTVVVSPDGKMLTATTTGINAANGQLFNLIQVFDKQ